MKKLIQLNKNYLLLILFWVINPVFSQSDSLSYSAFFSNDSIPLNAEAELICQFIYPLKSGGMAFQPSENWQYHNLMPGASGSKSSIIVRDDSVLYAKREYYFYYRPRTIGEASLTDITFYHLNAGDLLKNKISLGKVQLKVLPPSTEESGHRRGWLIILLFFVLNIVVISIFVSKRKRAKSILPYSRKYLNSLKNRMNKIEDISNEEFFQYFWELWEHHFHIELSSAVLPLNKQTIDILGLTGNQIDMIENVIAINIRGKAGQMSSQDRDDLIKSVKLFIHTKEKQIY